MKLGRCLVMRMNGTLLLLLILAQGNANTQGNASYCPRLETSAGCSCFYEKEAEKISLYCSHTFLEDVLISTKAVAETQQLVSSVLYRHLNIGRIDKSLLGSLRFHHFHADHSNVTSIDPDAFSGVADDLQSFMLNDNQLETVPTNVLDGMVKLKKLGLSHNRIEFLHSKSFKGLPSLETLLLSGNGIKFVDDLAFKEVAGSLTGLYLLQNKLNSVPWKALQHLYNLSHLDLGVNNITNLNPGGFEGMGKNLHHLDLDNNRLEEIPERAFANLSGLGWLALHSNEIRYIHPDAFKGLDGSLETLKLGENRLSAVPAKPLRRMRKLIKLELNGNSITKILDDDFNYYGRKLAVINLRSNRIHTIHEKAFRDLDSLRLLWLTSNQLSVLSSEIFHPILDTFRLISLTNNPLNCDCRMAWLRNLVQDWETSESRWLSGGHCETPQHLKNMKIENVREEDLVCVEESTPGAEDSFFTRDGGFLSLIPALHVPATLAPAESLARVN